MLELLCNGEHHSYYTYAEHMAIFNFLCETEKFDDGNVYTVRIVNTDTIMNFSQFRDYFEI